MIAPVVGPVVPVGSSSPSVSGPDEPNPGPPNESMLPPSVGEANDPVETDSDNDGVESTNPVTQRHSESSFETEADSEAEAESELVDVLLSDSFNFDLDNQPQESQETVESRLKSLRKQGATEGGGVAYSSSLVTGCLLYTSPSPRD